MPGPHMHGDAFHLKLAGMDTVLFVADKGQIIAEMRCRGNAIGQRPVGCSPIHSGGACLPAGRLVIRATSRPSPTATGRGPGRGPGPTWRGLGPGAAPGPGFAHGTDIVLAAGSARPAR